MVTKAANLGKIYSVKLIKQNILENCNTLL